MLGETKRSDLGLGEIYHGVLERREEDNDKGGSNTKDKMVEPKAPLKMSEVEAWMLV